MSSRAPPLLLERPSPPASSALSSSSSSNELPVRFFVPPEIISIIVNSGDWTPHDLTQLALVNHIFLLLARPLLYQSTHLQTPVTFALDSEHESDSDSEGEGYRIQRELIDRSKGATNKGSLFVSTIVASELLETLKEYAHLAPLVENMRWSCSYERESKNASEWEEEKKAILTYSPLVGDAITDVAHLLDCCPRLDSLQVKTDVWSWTDEITEALQKTAVIGQLKRFGWFGSGMWWDLGRRRTRHYQFRFENLSEMFRRMDRLSHLELGSVEADLRWFGEPSPTFPLCSLSIELGGIFETTFANSLLLNGGNTLQRLSIPAHLTRSLTGKFPSLQTLELGFTPFNRDDDFPTQAFLSQLPNLHHLCFTFAVKYGVKREIRHSSVNFRHPQFEWVPPTLQILSFIAVGIPSSSLTQIINTSDLREIKLRGFGGGPKNRHSPHAYYRIPASWDCHEVEAFYNLCEEKEIKVSRDDGDDNEEE